MARSKGRRGNRRRAGKADKPRHPWTRWPDERLLDVRLCDLRVRLEGRELRGRLRQVQEELEERDLRIRPYFYLSDEWFTPDGHTGVAIPFYLSHPRLMKLERAQVGEVEGGDRRWCMRLLRHEVAHVVQHAFRLNTRRRWQQLFGRSSHRYPRFYRPNPYSKRHVQHLEYWYAQSHPDEDFAETFAVWLRPRSPWRRRYAGWPALKKLEYVDALMAEISGRKPLVRTRARPESLPTIRKTLREHYKRKRAAYEAEYPRFYDRDLKRLFSTDRGKGARAAAALIRRLRPEIVRMVTPWTGENQYLLDHVVMDMVGRCRDLRLRTRRSDRAVRTALAILLTKHVMNSVFRKRLWLEL